MTKTITDATKGEEEDKIFRLHDMVVQEVSLVDRAANKRQFLVLKREDESMAKVGEELKPDGNGGFTTAKTDEGAPTPPELPPAPAAPTPVDDATAKVEDSPITPQVKQDVLRMLADALENLMTVATTVKAAQEDGGEEGNLPPTVVEGLKSIGGLLQGVVERYEAAPAAKQDDSTPEPKADDVPAPATPAAVSPVQGDDVLKSLMIAANTITAGPVDKAGRKMSKTRLDQLREAMKVLDGILSDVDPDEDLTAKGAHTDKDKKKVGKSADGAPAGDDQLAVLSKTVDDLNSTLKASRAAITKLQKNVGLPNSLPVEGGRTPPEQSRSEEVTWPQDMNSPISRESVGKWQWFESSGKQ